MISGISLWRRSTDTFTIIVMGRPIVSRRVAAVVVLSVTVACAALSLDRSVADPTWSDARAQPAIVVVRAGIVALAVAAVVLYRWRPATRPWMLMTLLSLTWSGWAGADRFVAVSVLAALIRPIVFVLLVSWPTGRLERGDAWWISIFAVLQAGLYSLARQLFVEDPYQTGRTSPLYVADIPRLAEMSASFGSAIVLPIGSALLVLTLFRRYRSLTGPGRRLFAPIVVAGVVFALGDGIVVLSDLAPELAVTDRGLTVYGGYVRLTLNFLPYVALPVLAMVAVHRTTTRQFERDWTIDLGRPGRSLDTTVRELTTGRAQLAYPLTDQQWIDQAGTPVVTDGGPTIAATIERDGEVLAAILTEPETVVDGDALELAVAAATGDVEFGRLEALANARARDAQTAIAALAVARRDTMERLERDLHDGVQQRLVGLALQASLAERQRLPDHTIATELTSGVAAARHDLAGCAAGTLPTLIAQRGLTNSITTLAATASIDLTVDIHYPADVPDDTAAAAWFVVAEAVANTTKHADASLLHISGGVNGGQLFVTIADNGCGGATTTGAGLSGLHTRVERSGGTLDIESPLGAGTTVRARFALTNRATP